MKTPAFTRGIAGLGVGLLIGLMLGLSASPVVATVMTALTGLLGGFIGVRSSSDNQTTSPCDMVFAITFAFAAILGIFTGLYMRNHNLLSPTLAQQKQQWIEIGFEEDQALALVVRQRLGTSSTKSANSTTASSLSGITSTYLFAGNASNCGKLKPASFSDNDELTRAWRSEGDRWEQIANNVEKNIPSDQQRVAYQILWRLRCKE